MELGWETTHATKYTSLNNLRSAVEDSSLAIADERILREIRSFTHSDAVGTVLAGLWRHQYFDHIPCPPDLHIPTDDPEAWEWNPASSASPRAPHRRAFLDDAAGGRAHLER